jgi:hypothetical protein
VINLDKLKPGTRITILMHPCHWKSYYNSFNKLFVVYPNPLPQSNGIFYCSFNYRVTAPIVLEIIDLNGKILFRQSYMPSEILPVPYYFNQRGVYMIKLSTQINQREMELPNGLLVY